jgi:rfaE bifunctional protein kinase chain/domain
MQEGKRSIAGLAGYVDLFASRGVLVVGDVMLDEYITGAVERISPEAPVAVVNVRDVEHRLGGAANVTANVRALGAKAYLAGVVGDDGFGRMLRERIAASGVDDSAVVVDAARPTSVKTRVIAQKQQIVRYDRESKAALPGPVATRLLQKIRAILPKVQTVVLSDYAKGVLEPAVAQAILKMARLAGKAVLVDPKIKNFASFKGATIITPNYKEACEAASLVAGIHVASQADLERAASKLVATMKIESLVVTKGEEGMYVFTPGRPPLHIPTAAREVYDVSGAGDTVIATLALGLAANAPLPEAAMLANHAAGVVVAKFGTATVSRQELTAALNRDDAAAAPPVAAGRTGRRRG